MRATREVLIDENAEPDAAVEAVTFIVPSPQHSGAASASLFALFPLEEIHHHS